ncbi:hypothetical protein [Beijerinckia mobilis]|uniref:hypothetical protein n=1 Tax=Beijerinckia mobilis TaxID=231434 RepID=UPI00054D3FFD|nr:hypothetical protein [Beijerinckia mobilis]
MAIKSNAGTQIFVGTATFPNNTYNGLLASDYTTDTFTAIGNVADIGNFGDTVQTIEANSIGDARVRKLQGMRDAGTLELTVNHDPADAGQTACRAASKSSLMRNFKIILDDKATEEGTGTTLYFRAITLGNQMKTGGPNDVVQQIFQLGINTDVLEVAAS